MHKSNRLLIGSAVLFLVSCGSPSTSLSREPDTLESLPTSSETLSYDNSNSVDSFIEEIDDINELTDLNQFPTYYLKRLSSYRSYKSVTKGNTKAKVLFIETDQSIDVTFIKGDYSYLLNESHSSLVNTKHEAYFHGNQTLAKNEGEDSFKKASLSEYLDAYGVNPLGYSIEGYSVSSGAIKSIERIEGEDTFVIAFDPEKATNNVRIQMKAFGQLDDYPVFSNILITIKVQKDFSPIKLNVKADYKAKKMVETDCHQEYEVTFSSYNEDMEVPDLAMVKELYGF